MDDQRANPGAAPKWFPKVMDALTNKIAAEPPSEPFPGLSYYFFHPTKKKPWRCVIYPSMLEIYGGKRDGAWVVPGFTVDLTSLMRVFDKLDRVGWMSPNHWRGHIDCPAVILRGVIDGERVMLTVSTQPPDDEEPIAVLDTYKKELRYNFDDVAHDGSSS